MVFHIPVQLQQNRIFVKFVPFVGIRDLCFALSLLVDFANHFFQIWVGDIDIDQIAFLSQACHDVISSNLLRIKAKFNAVFTCLEHFPACDVEIRGNALFIAHGDLFGCQIAAFIELYKINRQ